jgi:cephalosporin-C deacetylase-like acetyl esterase
MFGVLSERAIMKLLSVAATVALVATAAWGQSTEQLNFYSTLNDGRQARRMLTTYLHQKADRIFQMRRRKIAGFSSAEDVRERKQYLREATIRDIGGFPERTPLNARVVGVLDRGDYRVEKIIFESQPRFYVTANLYVPQKGQPPYPAILFPLGHEAGAKTNPIWQHLLVSFAKKGFVALAWDPVGQGERVQIYDTDFERSKLVQSTTEHTVVGIQCLLVGDSLARYTIWDGIRALDYLTSRPEVDPKRIGCTGNSGGGTHTAYLSALDDRIQVAAPSCYITSWERLLDTIGPQDAEQCLPPWLAQGLDHPDYIYAFAPKPFLILSAIRDFFPIYGARSTFQEAKQVYQMLGVPEKLSMVEADDGHGYSLPRRLASYRWFSRWLKGVEDTQGEPELTIASPEELQCTTTGQVITSLGGETVQTLNRKRMEEFRRTAKPASLEQVRSLVGFEQREQPLKVDPFGTILRNGYRIEKIVYESEPGIRVPALLYVPEKPGKKPAAVFVDGQGKAAADADAGQLARAGVTVLSIDARGLGETRLTSGEDGGGWARYFGDYENAMTALLLGKPLVAMRAEDVTSAVGLLAGRSDVASDQISVIGRGLGAVPSLYAAAFDTRIRKVALDQMLVSYQSVVNGTIHWQVFENIVQGALRHYDLPDLASWVAPRAVWIVDAVDPVGQLISLAEVNKQYTRAAARGHLRILRRNPEQTIATLLEDLFR